MPRKESMQQFHDRRTEQRGMKAEGRNSPNTPDSKGPGPKAWTKSVSAPKAPKPKGKGC